MKRGIVTLVLVIAATAAPAAAAPVRYACATVGEKLIVPPASPATVCERFRLALSRATQKTLRVDTGRLAASDSVPWIRVTLRFTKAGVASARVEQSKSGRVVVHPDSNVAVSDRAIGLQSVDLLARGVARAIDATEKVR